jgi:hypothetical protein
MAEPSHPIASFISVEAFRSGNDADSQREALDRLSLAGPLAEAFWIRPGRRTGGRLEA